MLEKLVECFYDEYGFLKEEESVTITKEAMIGIIEEVAKLKLAIKEER